jgi:hypothetical protein
MNSGDSDLLLILTLLAVIIVSVFYSYTPII